MTNPLVPITSGSLYLGGTKTQAFTVPPGLSQSYYTTTDTVAVEALIEDVINNGTVPLNLNTVSLQTFATATMANITATATETASLETFATGTSVLTASLLTLATSTLTFMTATAGATASIELFLTSTMAFITATATETASIESYLTGVAACTASLIAADADQTVKFNILSGNLDASASIWNAFSPAVYTVELASLEAYATATAGATASIEGFLTGVSNMTASWTAPLASGTTSPNYLYLTEVSGTNQVWRLYVQGGVLHIEQPKP